MPISGTDEFRNELAERVAKLDWDGIQADLDQLGYATTGPLLDTADCASITSIYPDEDRFRSHVVMERHGYGEGEYRYFAYPLPETVQTLREEFYPRLASIANRWNRLLGADHEFPPQQDDFLARCHEAGQTRPTPLILRYEAGGYNRLHQDLYGEHVFPLQLAILLSKPGEDFQGGEFVLTEQRPRMQSRAEVVPLEQGEAVIFAVHSRPVQGSRGMHRVNMRHGVSRLRRGERYALGIIFHDAA